VTGEEKYEVLILNNVMIWSRISVGSVYCDFLRGSVFGIRYLYLSYSHATSVSNDWHGGSKWWYTFELVLYWFHSHSSLFFGMVIRWFPMLVNISALSCMICIVGSAVFMSVSGLHSHSCI
jgi:hypothetical protein